MTCDHILGFHIGHSTISLSEAKKDPKALDETCCGGVYRLKYCPECGMLLVGVF